jgi:hypothetical protein
VSYDHALELVKDAAMAVVAGAFWFDGKPWLAVIVAIAAIIFSYRDLTRLRKNHLVH